MLSNFDIGDLVGAPLFTLGTAVSTGIASVSIFDVALTSNAATLDGTGISWAFLLSAVAILGALGTNNLGYEDVMELPDEELYAFGLGLATIVGIEFFSQIETFLNDGGIMSLLAMGVASAAYVVVAYRPKMKQRFR